MGQDSASTTDCMGKHLFPEAAACLEKLPFKDCTLVLKDGGRISCHRVELTKVSEVLGWAPPQICIDTTCVSYACHLGIPWPSAST